MRDECLLGATGGSGRERGVYVYVNVVVALGLQIRLNAG
jgi:hypothetical protein